MYSLEKFEVLENKLKTKEVHKVNEYMLKNLDSTFKTLLKLEFPTSHETLWSTYFLFESSVPAEYMYNEEKYTIEQLRVMYWRVRKAYGNEMPYKEELDLYIILSRVKNSLKGVLGFILDMCIKHQIILNIKGLKGYADFTEHLLVLETQMESEIDEIN